MTHSEFQAWLDRYVAAWKSYDPDAIGDLFAQDAEYRHRPPDEPIRGRAAIVADWLEEQDEPGTYDGHYEPLAIDGPVHVSSGWSRYYDERGELDDEYWNIYVCHFDDEGRCTSFTEWWTRSRQYDPED
jgi:ketosteroid isomerase-like protein